MVVAGDSLSSHPHKTVPLCPFDETVMNLGEAYPIRYEISDYRMKVNFMNNFMLICGDCSL